jgi:chromosome segregation ATPase
MKNNFSTINQNMNETQQKYEVLEKKFKESLDELLLYERKLSNANNKAEMLSKENELLKNQLSYFENTFSDMKKRKQNEINELKKSIEELNDEKEDLNRENNTLKTELRETKLKLDLLKKENDKIRIDNEHINQILDEKSSKIRISDEKINQIDNLINVYKKTNEDLSYEIEKINREKKLEKEESNKLIKEFENTLKKKNDEFDKTINQKKEEYNQRLSELIDENENIRSKCVGFKIERDKYFGDLNILNEEYEKLKNEFQLQDIRMQNFQKELDDEYSKKINHLNDVLRLTKNKNQELIEENNKLNIEIRNITGKNLTNEKLALNGEEMYKELIQLKKENEELRNEKNK